MTVNLKLVHKDRNKFDISKVESKYDASYVGEFCLNNNGWINQPCSLFYAKTPHPRGSNYFALLYMYDAESLSLDTPNPKLYITNGISAVVNRDGTSVQYDCVDCGDGQLLHSAYRHDYQEYNTYVIDGGRDYTRTNTPAFLKQFIILDGNIVLKT